MSLKHVDVVIISWAKDEEFHEITKKGLDSLFKSENGEIAFHAYVVESNREINYDEYNEFKWMHSCKTIHPEVPFGYHRYLNLGRKLGNSPYVVLCNNDLIFEKYWASNIMFVMEKNQHILSASPWCPQTLGDNTSHLNNIYQGYRVRGEIAGWCIFQQRKIYDILGDLDEQFIFWWCDNDYSMELQKNKISHCLAPMSVVNHHEHNTGKTLNSLDDVKLKKHLTDDQVEIFKAKWQNYLK